MLTSAQADRERLAKLGLSAPGLEVKEITVGKSARELAAEHGQAAVVALLRQAGTAEGVAQLQRAAGYVGTASAAPAKLSAELAGDVKDGQPEVALLGWERHPCLVSGANERE